MGESSENDGVLRWFVIDMERVDLLGLWNMAF